MAAYYNELDPFAAAWLRELIKANLIAPGEVDERSIEEVKAEDLKGFTQCHFFAGIGVWSYALRNAGWPDNESVWTGSCPCPPFSSAGTKKACPQCNGTNPVPHVGRTGYFVCCLCDHEWFADGRHLWPEMWRLISVGRPDAFFGEQVASNDGRTWLASVRASLEILGYAVGAADLCSAGVGSADIRQRLYFVADAQRQQLRAFRSRQVERSTTTTGREERKQRIRANVGERGTVGRLVNASESRCEGNVASSIFRERDSAWKDERATGSSAVSKLGHASESRLQRPTAERSVSERTPTTRYAGSSGSNSGMADADGIESSNGELQRSGRLVQPSPDPLTGFWHGADWIYCRDEKYRPVEPGTFPLAHGATNRVGRLRGYGNAINAEVAQAFIEAYLDATME